MHNVIASQSENVWRLRINQHCPRPCLILIPSRIIHACVKVISSVIQASEVHVVWRRSIYSVCHIRVCRVKQSYHNARQCRAVCRSNVHKNLISRREIRIVALCRRDKSDCRRYRYIHNKTPCGCRISVIHIIRNRNIVIVIPVCKPCPVDCSSRICKRCHVHSSSQIPKRERNILLIRLRDRHIHVEPLPASRHAILFSSHSK